MNHDLTITPVNSSSINEVIQTKQLKTTIESGPVKEILKKIKPETNFNEPLLKNVIQLNEQENKNISDALAQIASSVTNEINLNLLSFTGQNFKNNFNNTQESLKIISNLKNISSTQIDEDNEKRIRSLNNLKVKVNYWEYTPHCRFKCILCPSATSINYPKLHANKVTLKDMHFIAMQYPTTLQTKFLWELCLKNNSVIFDLTNNTDKRDNFLIDYFPNSSKPEFKDNLVKYLSNELLFEEKNPKSEVPNKIMLYQYEITDKTGNKIIIPRIHYTGWPDKSVPSMNEMTVIVKEVLKYPTEESKRSIIHCVAGSGRTVTLIVACLLFKYIQENKHASDKEILDFLELEIISARSQRGQHAMNGRQCQFLFYWGQYLRNETSSQ